MLLLFALGACSFLIAILLTPVCRDLFQRWGFVDHPDPERKLHTYPVPNMGGVPVVLSYLASFGIVWIASRAQIESSIDLSLAAKLVPAALIVLGAGLLDDRYRLGPVQKLLLQIAASVAAYFGGVRVEGISWHHLQPVLSFPATIVWLVVCTNAFNLIDGVDGLAAGVGVFATATTLVAALMQHNLPLAVATAPLAGALLGFLRYNFNPATIFLGDSGSLLIGFLLGCFGAMWTQKSATLLGMTAPVMALSIPILDVLLSIVRRYRRGQPIFRGDRNHIHHRLLALGLSQKRAVLMLYAVCALGAAFSIFQSAADRYAGSVILVFCAVMGGGVQWLRSIEIGVASRGLPGGPRGEQERALVNFERAIGEARANDERWEVLKVLADELKFGEIRWCAGDLDRRQGSVMDGWRLQVPLGGENVVELIRASDAERLELSASDLTAAIQRAMKKSTAHEAA